MKSRKGPPRIYIPNKPYQGQGSHCETYEEYAHRLMQHLGLSNYSQLFGFLLLHYGPHAMEWANNKKMSGVPAPGPAAFVAAQQGDQDFGPFPGF